MKRGEAIALRRLEEHAVERITPLLSAMDLSETKSSAEDVEGRVDQAMRDWPGAEVWIDVRLPVAAGEATAADLMAGAVHGAGDVTVVPVIGLDPGEAAAWPASDRLVLRLVPDDAMTLLGGGAAVQDLLARRGLDTESVDVVVDLETEPNATRAEGMIRGLAAIGRWRSVVVAAGNFARPSGAGLHRLLREDWSEWLDLARRPDADAAGNLRFGDYGVLEPDWTPPDAPAGAIDVAPRLTYTTDKEWIVARGRSVRLHGWEQICDVARLVTSQSEWAGGGFSFGDQEIDDWASEAQQTASSETTMRAAINHHITHVATQIASHPWT